MMVEVFKTNIFQEDIANAIQNELIVHFPEAKINFDLEDCDKILRIENCSVKTKSIIIILKQNGFECMPLD